VNGADNQTDGRGNHNKREGSFEPHMPDIAQWFTENPPKDAGI
jgi:hypothetical protein